MIGSGVLGYCPCWCPSLFSSPSICRGFSIQSSSPAIEFHSCFFFTTDASAPISRPFPYSLLGEFPDFHELALPVEICGREYYNQGMYRHFHELAQWRTHIRFVRCVHTPYENFYFVV